MKFPKHSGPTSPFFDRKNLVLYVDAHFRIIDRKMKPDTFERNLVFLAGMFLAAAILLSAKIDFFLPFIAEKWDFINNNFLFIYSLAPFAILVVGVLPFGGIILWERKHPTRKWNVQNTESLQKAILLYERLAKNCLKEFPSAQNQIAPKKIAYSFANKEIKNSDKTILDFVKASGVLAAASFVWTHYLHSYVISAVNDSNSANHGTAGKIPHISVMTFAVADVALFFGLMLAVIYLFQKLSFGRRARAITFTALVLKYTL